MISRIPEALGVEEKVWDDTWDTVKEAFITSRDVEEFYNKVKDIPKVFLGTLLSKLFLDSPIMQRAIHSKELGQSLPNRHVLAVISFAGEMALKEGEIEDTHTSFGTFLATTPRQLLIPLLWETCHISRWVFLRALNILQEGGK